MTATTATTEPKYTVLSSTYSTFKETWELGKNYKLISTVLTTTEGLGEKALALTGKYTGASDLKTVDDAVTPSLLTADTTMSPYLESGVEKVTAVETKLEPVTSVVKKVLPVVTATKVGAYAMKTAEETAAKVEVALRLETPEVTQ